MAVGAWFAVSKEWQREADEDGAQRGRRTGTSLRRQRVSRKELLGSTDNGSNFWASFQSLEWLRTTGWVTSVAEGYHVSR